jgi:hypothetical protein
MINRIGDKEMNQPYAPIPPATRTSTAAVISLVAGILGFVQILPVIGPIAAVIAGHIAKSEIKKERRGGHWQRHGDHRFDPGLRDDCHWLMPYLYLHSGIRRAHHPSIRISGHFQYLLIVTPEP